MTKQKLPKLALVAAVVASVSGCSLPPLVKGQLSNPAYINQAYGKTPENAIVKQTIEASPEAIKVMFGRPMILKEVKWLVADGTVNEKYRNPRNEEVWPLPDEALRKVHEAAFKKMWPYFGLDRGKGLPLEVDFTVPIGGGYYYDGVMFFGGYADGSRMAATMITIRDPQTNQILMRDFTDVYGGITGAAMPRYSSCSAVGTGWLASTLAHQAGILLYNLKNGDGEGKPYPSSDAAYRDRFLNSHWEYHIRKAAVNGSEPFYEGLLPVSGEEIEQATGLKLADYGCPPEKWDPDRQETLAGVEALRKASDERERKRKEKGEPSYRPKI